MRRSSTPEERPTCARCGKALKVTANVYDYPRINNVVTKVKIGETPAINLYAPFCTLRCGWRWAKENIGRKRK